MKLRKLLAGMLTLALGMSLAAPAMAVDNADQRLNQVTRVVKTTLAVPDDYTEFYGQPEETPLGIRWDLNWNAEEKGLNVTATDAGKVLNYNRWENEPYVSPADRGNGFGPSFPAMTRDEARQYAQAFLNKVLDANEKAEFKDQGGETLSATSYHFGGMILLNDTKSPLSFSITVRLSDGAVMNFWRGDSSDYAGKVPAPTTVTTAEKAAELLKGTVSMKLEYVLADSKEGEPKVAVLRYLPEYGDNYYVDAATGKLVNLTELQKQLRGDYDDMAMGASAKYTAANDAAAPEAAEQGLARLTEAELEGVAKLEGVLDQDALEKAVKAWKELALEGYAIAGARYTVNKETGDVTALLTFSKNAQEGVYRRNVTVDAKTGALQSMYSSNPWMEEAGEVKLDEKAAQAKAEAFLKALWGNQFAKTQVYSSSATDNARGTFSFTFAQKENGYFFPSNSVYVTVDPVDGSIRSFSKNFDDDVTFESAEGIVSLDKAIDVWAGSFPVDFGYMEVPVALDLQEEPILFKGLVDAGYKYYNALKPGYGYGSREGWYLGVDAKTGELVKGDRGGESDQITYDDISGHWAEAILKELAGYNVGWFGGKADPAGALTQRDYLVLLLSAEGYHFDVTDKDQLDDLYRTAYRRKLLTAEERNETKALNRSEMVKMLLDSLGYGPVAQLQGIFKVGFNDADAIPEAELGYAALAQGLGIVKGDDMGNFAPARQATRCEGAVMLWQYMKR